jgi:hypothetical protein
MKWPSGRVASQNSDMRRRGVQRQRVFDQALDRREAGVAGGKHQRVRAVGQHELAAAGPQR